MDLCEQTCFYLLLSLKKGITKHKIFCIFSIFIPFFNTFITSGTSRSLLQLTENREGGVDRINILISCISPGTKLEHMYIFYTDISHQFVLYLSIDLPFMLRMSPNDFHNPESCDSLWLPRL